MTQQARSAPSQVPISAKEIVNPERGQYSWHTSNRSANPVDWPVQDTYPRGWWKHANPSKGKYNFNMVQVGIDAAVASKSCTAFRYMNSCIDCGESDRLTLMPDYVTALDSTWQYVYSGGASGTWMEGMGDGQSYAIPDWNDPRYISAWTDFMNELGASFNGHPNLSYVDISGYGHYGEGHNYPYNTVYPTPAGHIQGTKASIKKIAKATLNAFPDTTCLWNLTTFCIDATNKFSETDTDDLFLELLAEHPNMGLRYDCVGGGPTQNGAWGVMRRSQQKAEARGVPERYQPYHRWKWAPFVTEWCTTVRPVAEGAGNPTAGTMQEGHDQVSQWHLSLLSSANFQYGYTADFRTAYSNEEVELFYNANKRAGYRYTADAVVMDLRVSDDSATAHVEWSNLNVAPCYRSWQVTYEVQNAAGDILAEVPSTLDLRTVLPGPVVTDTARIPAEGLPANVPLTLAVRVTDPSGALKPLNLSIDGKLSNGGYPLTEFLLLSS